MLKHAASALFCLILMLSPLCALPALGAGQAAEPGHGASSQSESGEAAANLLEQARQALDQSGAALKQAEQEALAPRRDGASPMTEQERNILLLSDSDYLTALEQYNAARSDYDEAMAAWQMYSDGGETAPFELKKAEQGRGTALSLPLLLLFLIPGIALVRRRARRR